MMDRHSEEFAAPEAAEESSPLGAFDWRRYVHALVKRWKVFLLVFLLTAAIGLGGAMQLRGKAFRATVQILHNADTGGVDIGSGSHFSLPETKLDTLVDTVKLPSNLEKVAGKLEFEGDVYDLIGRITLSKKANGDIIYIEAVEESKGRAMALANTVAEVFVEYLENLRKINLQKAVEKFNLLAQSAREKFNEASEQLTEFKQKYGITMLDVETELSLSKLDSLSVMIDNSRAELNAINQQIARYGSVKSVYESDQGSGEAEVEELRQQLRHMRERYTENNPKISRLKQKIGDSMGAASGSAKARLDSQRMVLRNKIAAMTAQKQEMERKLSHLTKNEKGFASVQQKYLFSKNMLESLMTQREEALAEQKNPKQEFRIIQSAFPDEYPLQSKAKIVALAVPLLGLFATFIIILLVEFLNPSIKTAREVFLKSGVHVLGQHIHDPDAFDDRPHMEVGIYKPVAATLSVEHQLDDVRLLAFFSTVSGSGQTTAVENFAKAFTSRKMNVLVMDLTIYPERQFELALDLVLEDEAPVWSLIEKSSNKSPDRLIAGLTHARDLEWFGHMDFSRVLKELSERYDLVLIDAPPIFEFVQSIELIPLIDAAMLVVRAGNTKKDHFERMYRSLGELDKTILGAFIVDAEPFFARNHEIVTAGAYREIEIGKGYVENSILTKIMSW